MQALTTCRRIKSQLKSQEDAHQKQLETARREVQKVTDRIHEEHRAKEEELQRQLEYVKKTAEAATARAQRRAETELAEAKKKAEAELAEARKKAESEIAEAKKTAEAQSTRAQRRAEADMADLRATISRFEIDLMKVSHLPVAVIFLFTEWTTRQTRQKPKSFDLLKTSMLQPSKQHKKHMVPNSVPKLRGLPQPRQRPRQLRIESANSRNKSQISRNRSHRGRTKRRRQAINSTRLYNNRVLTLRLQAQSQLKTKDEEKAAVQTELDDLLMVFGDLEEKVEKYKVSLMLA